MILIKTYLITFISLLRIYLLTLKKRKNIIFYFPVKIYQKNLISLANSLSKKNGVFMIYNMSSTYEIKKLKNSLLIDFNLLKYIPFNRIFLSRINIFISSYLSYVYPPNSKNIYLSHDIYDAPMINYADEKSLFLRINKLDYIFVSSNLSKKYFFSKFKSYKINNNPKIINTGYLKLDHLIKNFKSKRKRFLSSKKLSILLSPGYFYAYKKYNMKSDIEKVIEKLVKINNITVIFRPHPLDLTKKGDKFFINKIYNKFKKFDNFTINKDVSYVKEFFNSNLMITDLSSIAYTYSFSTNKPVLFYSKNENKLSKKIFGNTNYFKDRGKIGKVINNTNNLMKNILFLKKNLNIFKRKINSLKKNKIENINKSEELTIKSIENILNI